MHEYCGELTQGLHQQEQRLLVSISIAVVANLMLVVFFAVEIFVPEGHIESPIVIKAAEEYFLFVLIFGQEIARRVLANFARRQS